jgi:hypothetical protein
MMDFPLLIPLLVSLLGIAFLARKLVKFYPNETWVIILFRAWYGPRTDLANMTKAQLYESGLQFVTWGLIFMSAFFFVGIVGRSLYSGNWPSGFMMLWFFCALLTSMGFCGGAYLLLRAAIRPDKWVPPKQ